MSLIGRPAWHIILSTAIILIHLKAGVISEMRRGMRQAYKTYDRNSQYACSDNSISDSETC